MLLKNLFISVLLVMSIVVATSAQPTSQKSANSFSFIDYQRTLPRPSEALLKKEDTLQKQFVDDF